jgi:hypothetical protein
MKATVLLAITIALSSCVPTPDYYSIPPQHNPAAIGAAPGPASDLNVSGEMFEAAASDAGKHIVKDVRGLEGAWRWTLAAPELRFELPAGELHRKFRMDLGINDRTFRDTGPVKVVIYINGREFDHVTFDHFGDQTWEKPVPVDYLKPGAENRVEMRILNPWQAADGLKLGFVLRSAGFISQ